MEITLSHLPGGGGAGWQPLYLLVVGCVVAVFSRELGRRRGAAGHIPLTTRQRPSEGGSQVARCVPGAVYAEAGQPSVSHPMPWPSKKSTVKKVVCQGYAQDFPATGYVGGAL